MLTTLHTTKKKSSSRSDKLFDRLVLFVSILYPLSATPQLIAVFQGKADGVSVISWIAFLVCAGLFLAYGLRHKVWPMILSNTLWVVVDSLVVIGIMSYRI